MADISFIIGTLRKALPLITKYAKEYSNKSEVVLKICQDLGIEIKPDNTFESVYVHTVLNYANSRDPGLVEVFKQKDVLKAFYEEYWNEKENSFKYELQYQLNRNTDSQIRKLKETQQINEIPSDEIKAFIEEFRKQTNRTRNPAEREEYLINLETRDSARRIENQLRELAENPNYQKSSNFQLLSDEHLKFYLHENYSKDIEEIYKLFSQLKYKEALKALQRLENNHWDKIDDKNRYKLLCNIGICLFELDKLRNASKKFKKANLINPSDDKSLVP